MLHLNPVDLGVVAVVALIVLGPEKLPGALRTMGRLWGELARMRAGLESQIRSTLGEDVASGLGSVAARAGGPLVATASLLQSDGRSRTKGTQSVVARPSFNPMAEVPEEAGPDDPCWN